MNAHPAHAGRKFGDFVSILPEDWIISVNLYVDESGIDGTSKVVSVGGYIGRRQEWQRFCVRWSQVLARYKVPSLHTVEFMNEELIERNPTSPYRGWSADKREQYILDLASVAKEHTHYAIVSLVGVRDYNTVFPDFLKQHIGNPYYFCLQGLFEIVLHDWNRMYPRHRPRYTRETSVGFIFEKNLEFNARTITMFNSVSQFKDRDRRMGAIAFATKEEAIPLQAADLVTYRMRKIITQKLERNKPFDLGSWDTALGGGDTLNARYHNADTLKEIADRVTAKWKKDPENWWKDVGE